MMGKLLTMFTKRTLKSILIELWLKKHWDNNREQWRITEECKYIEHLHKKKKKIVLKM